MKKKRNELKGIKPFNYMWIGTCFHHDVCSAMSCLGVDEKQFLLSQYSYYSQNLQCKLVMDNIDDIYAKLGIEMRDVYDLNESKIIDLIDNGVPLVAGMDCYWVKLRPDYKRVHANHFVLVYGYDLRRKVFLTVDNDFILQHHFVKNEISFKDFKAGNESFVKLFGIAGRAGKAIYKVENGRCDFSKMVLSKENLIESEKNCVDNLMIINKFLELPYIEFADIINRLDRYISDCVKNRNILLYCADILRIKELIPFIEELNREYLYLKTILDKILIKNTESLYNDKKEQLKSIFQGIKEKESKLHAMLILDGQKNEEFRDFRMCQYR